MVTAWSPSGKPRTRFSAGPLRVLWLAALLFGFLYSHGVSAESAAGHQTAGAVASSAHPAHSHAAGEQARVTAGHNDDGQEPTHPAEECVSGQPQQGPAWSAPLLTPAVGHLPCDGIVSGKSGPAVARSALPPLSSSASYVVQQV